MNNRFPFILACNCAFLFWREVIHVYKHFYSFCSSKITIISFQPIFCPYICLSTFVVSIRWPLLLHFPFELNSWWLYLVVKLFVWLYVLFKFFSKIILPECNSVPIDLFCIQDTFSCTICYSEVLSRCLLYTSSSACIFLVLTIYLAWSWWNSLSILI
jgi:hypothetical protein